MIVYSPDNLTGEFLIHSSNVEENASRNESDQQRRVRLMASYDMAWSKRGTGRSYDSLNGFGAMIGSQTGLVLNYGTRNRKCRMCDTGRDKSQHDCRCNFAGSAKAMEGHLAAELATNSTVLKSCNSDIGILIGDEDSSTIAAIRRSTSEKVVKLSDVNHVEKGVTKKLYELKMKHKELSAEGIQWIQSCFSYALKQNVGNTKKIAEILLQIPLHAFNDHSTCHDWCKSFVEKENYEHRRVPGGFKSTALFHDLQVLFMQLATNCAKFSHGSSSQANESLNASMASVAPKMRCYSTSESADFRYAATVAKKNLGSQYIGKVAQNLSLSPTTKHTTKYMSAISRIARRRKEKAKSKQFKSRRNILKKKRSQLKNKKEGSEGTTYKSNAGLVQNDFICDDNNNNITELSYLDSSSSSAESILVYFDLETGSLALNADILQIGLRYKEHSLGIYIPPTKPISDSASRVNNLSYSDGELLFHGKRVASVPLLQGLKQVLNFLSSIKKPCILVAHNARFDSSRLIFSLRRTQLLSAFSEVIIGFADT